ncbi:MULTISPECIES: stage II sporulation protein M [Desulfofundulus]|uniref:Stage II sporulation protein M n=1 Tax=Desulfofundulus australicus DSM 11792 TaxID=1121425 RepID=A0A1M5AEW3_9FIRM|nr:MULTISPECIES: stage II sporulation protein M [Desulfofundulus]MBE3584661.1 stage II sporulation protein M [Thermoanaerobacter sp.]MCS5694756.1 stage II sporulation protein M [Desulfofundulus thermocisternus]MDK2887602.1 stage sporulation protein [Thermoanaerobacter sp.]SHF28636.1 stage II sporulation protein M [Desulfofundulus australicus DSM 11792]
MFDVFRHSLRSNWPLCLLVLIFFLLGLVCGALNLNFLSPEQLQELHDYIDTFIKEARNLNLEAGRVAWEAMYGKMLAVAVLYLLGLTFIGIPVILALIFLKGFALGFTIAYLNYHLAWSGLLLVLACIIPQHVLYLPALFVATVASLSFAVVLFPRPTSTWSRIWGSFARYTAVMMVALAVAVGAGLVEAFLTPWLARMVAGILN